MAFAGRQPASNAPPIGTNPLGGVIGQSYARASAMGGGVGDFEIRPKGITKLIQQLTVVKSTIAGIRSEVNKLSDALESAQGNAKAFAKVFTGAGVGTAGGETLSTAGFAAPPVPAGQQATVAAQTASGAPPGGRTTTPAGFSSPPGGAGAAVGLGVLGELASRGAGAVNTAVGNFLGGGLGIDVMARQARSIFGAGTGTTANYTSAYTNIRNYGSADLTQAVAALQANPALFGSAGSQRTKRLTGFLNAVQMLVPTMTAGQGAQFANLLTSGTAMNVIQRFAPQGALLRPAGMGGGLNTPQQVLSTLLRIANGGQNLTRQQMIGQARNAQSWMAIENYGPLSQLGLSAQDFQALRQYEASGGNLSAAQNFMRRAPAFTGVTRTTAKTRLGMNVFESTAGIQNVENEFVTAITNMTNTLVTQNRALVAGGYGITQIATSATSLASHVFDIAAAVIAIKSLLGGSSALAEGGGVIGALKGALGMGGGAAAGAETAAGGGILSRLGGGLGSLYGGGAIPGSFTQLAGRAGVAGLGYFASQLIGSAISGGQTHGARSDIGNIIGYGGKLAALGSILGPWGALAGGVLGAGYGALKSFGAGRIGHDIGHGVMSVGHDIGHFFGGLFGDPTGETSTTGMQASMARRVNQMRAANPNLRITSGHRTRDQQALVYAMKGPRGAVRPGRSLHEHGAAVDIGPPSQLGWIARNARRFGLGQPSQKEPWHLQMMGDALPYPSPANNEQYAKDVLSYMGLPRTSSNVDVFAFTTESRTGYGRNPLGNTQAVAGSQQIPVAAYGDQAAGAALNATGHGVQAYSSWLSSIQAVAMVLRQANNAPFLKALKTGKTSLANLESLFSASTSSWAGEKFAPGILPAYSHGASIFVPGPAGGAGSVGGAGGGFQLGPISTGGVGGALPGLGRGATKTQKSAEAELLRAYARGRADSGIGGDPNLPVSTGVMAATRYLSKNRYDDQLAMMMGALLQSGSKMLGPEVAGLTKQYGDAADVSTPTLMRSGNVYHLHMPIQLFGKATQADGEDLARTVSAAFKKIEDESEVAYH